MPLESGSWNICPLLTLRVFPVPAQEVCKSPGAQHYLGKKAAASQPVMVLDVTVTSDLSQVFIVVELRKVFQVTLEFSLTQELLYPFGAY